MGAAMMNRMSHHFYTAGALIAWLLVLMTSSPARSAEREFRSYMDFEYTALQKDGPVWHLALKQFLRVENRFRTGELVYQQWNMGLKIRLLSWISVQEYYTPREQMYAGKTRVNKDVVGSDLLFNPSYGPLRLLNRQANEWHLTDRFYRYRNLTELACKMPAKWLLLDVSEEFRFDSDQRRINQNDVGGGLQIDLSKSLTLRVFYDLEASRRLLPTWQYVHFLGLSVGAHL